MFTAVQLQDSAGEEEDDELTLEGNRFGSLQMAVLQRSAVHPAYLILCLICCELSTVCLGLNVRRWARGDRLKGPRNRQKQPTDNCSAVNSAPSKDLNSIAKCCVIVQWRWLTIQATGYKNTPRVRSSVAKQRTVLIIGCVPFKNGHARVFQPPCRSSQSV